MSKTDNDIEERKQYLQKMSDFYAEDSNLAMSLCNETTRNLNGLLMTASLAYIGVMTAVLGADTLQSLSCLAKTFIILGILCFVASIIFGIFESVMAIKLFRRTSPKYMEIANLLMEAVYDENELDNVDSKQAELSIKKNSESGKILLYLQIGSFWSALFLPLFIFCLQ